LADKSATWFQLTEVPETHEDHGMAYEFIRSETRGAVAVVTLNRPKALNALSLALIRELGAAIAAADADDGIGCIVLTGSEKAFAAGADIKEMAGLTFAEAYLRDYPAAVDGAGNARKPIVAAVAGYCLGGGCELMMMCDVVIAADSAKFGQPEITIGVGPGFGGSQRLPRAIGKAKAMDLILTGRMMDAAEAERAGLVSRVVADARLMAEAMAVAEKIAGFSRAGTLVAKETVNRAFETPLAEGLRFERRMFHALFGTEDQKEGMAAFVAKRPPKFRNR
jgi:enoyl-CoA hydratase